MADGSYGLMPSTAQVFDIANKMNKEIIFALYYNKTNDNGHGYWYSTSTGVLADITLYSAEDNRFNLINTYTKISNSLYAMTKWMDTYDAQFTTQVGNDFPMLRYADVVLMYAEALGQQGNISEALTYLNKTRTRASLPELT